MCEAAFKLASVDLLGLWESFSIKAKFKRKTCISVQKDCIIFIFCAPLRYGQQQISNAATTYIQTL